MRCSAHANADVLRVLGLVLGQMSFSLQFQGEPSTLRPPHFSPANAPIRRRKTNSLIKLGPVR